MKTTASEMSQLDDSSVFRVSLCKYSDSRALWARGNASKKMCFYHMSRTDPSIEQILQILVECGEPVRAALIISFVASLL